MKSFLLALMLLVLMTACATTGTDNQFNDSRISWGGSYRVRAAVSH